MGTTQIANRYELLRKLGRGAMANVFLARDHREKRDVAIKLLMASNENEEDLYYFQREARAAAALRHPGIVRVFSYSEPDEQPAYIVMEVIDGVDLKQLLKACAPLTEGVVLALLSKLADAIAYAHGEGVIHRDIKPGNVMVTHDGRVCLSDFGLAKAYLDPAMLGQTVAGRATGLAGTPAYMAPEQVTDGKSGPESDVFSFGCLAYALAFGKSPFHYGDLLKVYRSVSEADYRPLNEVCPDLADSLVTLVHRTLSREAKQRPKAQEIAKVALRLLQVGGYPEPRFLLKSLLELYADDTEPEMDKPVEQTTRSDEPRGTGTELANVPIADDGPEEDPAEDSCASTVRDPNLTVDPMADGSRTEVTPLSSFSPAHPWEEEPDPPIPPAQDAVLAPTELFNVRPKPPGVGGFVKANPAVLIWASAAAVLVVLAVVGFVTCS